MANPTTPRRDLEAQNQLLERELADVRAELAALKAKQELTERERRIAVMQCDVFAAQLRQVQQK